MRFFIKLAYKGTDFHGWQNQPNADSVQNQIEKALQILLKKPTEIVGCGRTDSGVHASEYFAHFDAIIEKSLSEFAYKLNAILPQTIVIQEVVTVADHAHARFDAIYRSYQYHILLTNNPFELETTWQLPSKKFDVAQMNEASKILLKHHDFQCFSKSNTDVKNYLCTINKAYWTEEDYRLTFHISANRFLRNMVRAVVGTLLEVGERKLNLQEFEEIILSKNRSKAGFSVPAKGLFLSEIVYPKEIFII